MLIDLHAHTKGISHCCRIEAADGLLLAKESGFDGLAITNHYTRSYFTDESYDEWIEKYIAEWELCRRIGKELALKIFCGAEVTVEADPKLHMLVYGTNEDFLRRNKKLCDLSVSELSRLCRSEGCALVQAHPFRGGATVQDTDLLDGVEINCHPLYGNSYAEKLTAIARRSGLGITCGCDYHADTYRALGGSFLPENISTDRQLAGYIKNSNEFFMRVHEPKDGQLYRKEYRRIEI